MIDCLIDCFALVPHGLNDKAYKTGEWLKFVKMSQIVSIVSSLKYNAALYNYNMTI
jgi:hypothetical protein